MILDVMPTDSKILGFSNVWYQIAMSEAIDFTLPNEKTIKIVTAPYFLATKIEGELYLFKGMKTKSTSKNCPDVEFLRYGKCDDFRGTLKMFSDSEPTLYCEYNSSVLPCSYMDLTVVMFVIQN